MAADTSEQSRGFVFATSAYLIWGLMLPAFMKLLGDVPALEIVAHRIVWAVPFAALILWWLGGLANLGPIFRSPRTLLLASVTASIISVNWGVYVYAILTDRTLDAALGYYINPLVNVVMGAIFLGERPTRWQGVAIALAALAVAVLTVQAGGLPWISLVLAFSFGTYGLLRKILPIGPTEGFFVEVVLLSVPCLAYIAWTLSAGTSHFVSNPSEAWLLICAGPLTAIPLILFAAGAKRLDYSTIGILQYIAPTALFFTAVFAFGEPFSAWQGVAFALIWVAVVIYVWSLVAGARARRERAVTAGAETCPS
ncbi:permease [Aureimonas sp. SA4125]|uniref:EamA family transporter RarD n=1 Tax=Aureimonas sp. SA4125 TaxID=2826993 RepID=UPI001CC792D2|nr:EamA family transporter RarD [Aureimonas sp. SA4125]BDA83859.1 permease [Aureimonas sp. SA4125]